MTPLAEIRSAVKETFGIDPCRSAATPLLAAEAPDVIRARYAFIELARRLTDASSEAVARALGLRENFVRRSTLAIRLRLCDDSGFYWDITCIEAALQHLLAPPRRAWLRPPPRRQALPPKARIQGVTHGLAQNPRR